MTMFKTKEKIEEMMLNYLHENYKCHNGENGSVFIDGFLGVRSMDKKDLVGLMKNIYTQAQQDIKEACSEGFDDCFSKYATESNLHHEFDAHYFWQAAKLSSMKELQEKDEEIRDSEKREKELSERLVSLLKDFREKDEEIARLKKLICKCDTSVGFICESCHEQMNWHKYQEAVKDIEFLLNISRPLACMDRDMVEDIWSRYGLN